MKVHRFAAGFLVLLSLPLMLFLAAMNLHYDWQMFVMVLWEIPVLLYGVIVLSMKCPRCGGPFFYRENSRGFKFWFGRNCRTCGFPAA